MAVADYSPAITIALTVLDNSELSVAPAMYGLLMFFPATVAGFVFSRDTARRAAQADSRRAR